MDLLNIYLLVQEFYAIEAITAMLAVKGNNFELMKHSHHRWYRDFNDFRNEYISKFASAIYDYTILVVAAELRHCRNRASQYIKDYYACWQTRDEAFRDGSVYNPQDILKAGIRMFGTEQVRWNSAYGGDKWKQIAKAGLMKGKVNDCVFIDHCVDLSHNSSIYFDKSAKIFILMGKDEYQLFLDLKRCCEPQMLIKTKQGYRFNRLLWRANNLSIIKEQPTASSFSDARDEAESLLFDYHPVKWGRKRLDYSESNIITRINLDSNMRRIWDDDREDNFENNRGYARCA